MKRCFILKDFMKLKKVRVSLILKTGGFRVLFDDSKVVTLFTEIRRLHDDEILDVGITFFYLEDYKNAVRCFDEAIVSYRFDELL